jgi:tryptophan synthase beta chain
MAAKDPYRIYLDESEIPTQWYNVRADMPNKPGRMLLPNGVVAEVAHISPVFAEELCKQELDDDTAYFDIPEGVREMYKVYRPSPL